MVNRNWSDVRIYAVYLDSRHSLGTVTAMGTRRLSVPSTFLSGFGGVVLVIEPIRSRISHSTEPVAAGPGSLIQLSVENNLRATRCYLRGP